MAFGSGESDFGDSGSITVASSGNAHQQAGSIAVASSSIKTRVIMPRRSKRVSKGMLCDQAMINPDSSATTRLDDTGDSRARGVTRKRNAEDSSTKSRKKGTATSEKRFEGRYKQQFGHCNVSSKYSVNPSLGQWCNTMRCAHNKIQQGRTPRSNLTEDQIACLEEIGFKWKIKETFEQRCHDLETFKSEFGHCNIPFRYSVNPSLGKWCSNIRYSYNQSQQGQTPRRNLTQAAESAYLPLV